MKKNTTEKMGKISSLFGRLLCVVLFSVVAGTGCGGTVGGVNDNENLNDGDARVDGGDDGGEDPHPDAGDDAGEEEDDAVFVSQNVPSSLSPGESFTAQFVMQNTGSTTWSEDGMYRLGSQSPEDNQTWGTGRLYIELSVAPGETYAFQATLTAPSEPGVYQMQWRMVHEQVRWFGEMTGLINVEVVDDCHDHCNNGQLDLQCGETYIDCGGPCGPCDPVEIAPPPMEGSYPRLAVAPDGRVMLVWAEQIEVSQDNYALLPLKWSCFNGFEWTAVAPTVGGSGSQGYPWIVSDSDGKFHLVHDDGGGDGRHVHYNRWDHANCTGGWHDPAEVLPRQVPYTTPYPSVGVDEHGRAYVTYSQGMAPKPEDFPNNPCPVEGCPENYHCYPSSPFDICVPNYEQHFTWRQSGVFGSGQWTSPEAIGENLGVHAHHGAVFVQDSTKVHAAWMQDPTPGNHRIYYAQFNGSAWSPAEDTGIGAHAVDVQAFDDKVYVFTNNALFTSRDVSGGPWAGVTDVSGGAGATINLVNMRVGADGQLHAVWNGDFRVMYAVTDTAGNWLPPKPVSPEVVDDTLYANEPGLAVDDWGRAHIAWSQSACSFLVTGGAECEYGSIWYLAVRYEDLP